MIQVVLFKAVIVDTPTICWLGNGNAFIVETVSHTVIKVEVYVRNLFFSIQMRNTEFLGNAKTGFYSRKEDNCA